MKTTLSGTFPRPGRAAALLRDASHESPGCSRPRRGARRGQALVEFGLIALLVTLLLFGIFDFGMLFNAWVNVSSGASDAARQASVGRTIDEIDSAARQTIVPGLISCSSSGVPTPCARARKVIVSYTSAADGTVTTYCRGFNSSPSSSAYTVTAGGQTFTCQADNATPTPAAGDSVSVEVLANTFDITTPLVRPFFGCTNGSQQYCFVPLSSTTTARFEGVYI